MNAPIPRDMCCNDLVGYMSAGKNYAANWYTVNAEEAAVRANGGHPTFGLMYKKGRGHIVMARPGNYLNADGPRCAQAGRTCAMNIAAKNCIGISSKVKWRTFRGEGSPKKPSAAATEKVGRVTISNKIEELPIAIYYRGEDGASFRHISNYNTSLETAYVKQCFLIVHPTSKWIHQKLSNGTFQVREEGLFIQGTCVAWQSSDKPPEAESLMARSQRKFSRSLVRPPWINESENKLRESKFMQECLAAIGLLEFKDLVREHGLVGEKTREAVKRLQVKHSIAPGEMKPLTWAALIADTSSLSVPTDDFPSVATNTEQVKALQRALLAAGVFPPEEILTEWGSFGVNTRRALIHFQLHSGIAMTSPGTYGPKTRAALAAFLKDRQAIYSSSPSSVSSPAKVRSAPDSFKSPELLNCFSTVYSHDEKNVDYYTAKGHASTDPENYFGLRKDGSQWGLFRYADKGVIGVAAVDPKKIPYGSIIEWSSKKGARTLRFVCTDTGYPVVDRTAAKRANLPNLVVDFFVPSSKWADPLFPSTGLVKVTLYRYKGPAFKELNNETKNSFFCY